MSILEWLTGILLLVLPVIILLLFYLQKIYREKLQSQKLLQEQKKLAKKLREKQKRLELANKKLDSDVEKVKFSEKKIEQEEKRIESLSSQLFRKEELFTKQLILNSQREEKLHKEMEKLRKLKQQIIDDLGRMIPMSSEEAEKKLFSLLREEIDNNLNKYKEEELRKTQEKVKEEATKIICLALESYSSELAFTRTTKILPIENQQVISRVIGKEGRNINAFRRITGTEVIIDRESNELNIQISSFNSLRREIAFQTLHSLLREERFSPIQIEKTFQRISSEIDELVVKSGEEVLKELELSSVHPELIKCLGKLKYRTSYGQNVLEHCLEVAKLSGVIAAELHLDVLLSRRAGLFHDIGKVVEDNGGYSHVLSGIDLARKYGESEIVINAIAAHHRDYPADNLYSLIVIAADKLSATRPGARGQQLEAYVERMNSLENIAQSFPGIKKSYAFQAGREVWVIADSEKLTDHQTWEIAQKIKKKIKEKIIIPGEVTIYVIREKRFVQKLNSNKPRENIPFEQNPVKKIRKDKKLKRKSSKSWPVEK